MGIMEDFRKKLKTYHEEEERKRKEEEEKALENKEITEEEMEAIEQAHYHRKKFTGVDSFARMYDATVLIHRGHLNICNPIVRDMFKF